MEEVGELSRIMVRKFGEQSFKESETPPPLEEAGRRLSDELADVLWVLICLANQTGVDLTDALEKNFEKKNRRDGERHKRNEKLR
jgi:NTP pyrophosphatase (non-canonical NTP hydrolase)